MKLINQDSLHLDSSSCCLFLCSSLGRARFPGRETAQSWRTTKYSQVALRGLVRVDRNSESLGSLLPAAGPWLGRAVSRRTVGSCKSQDFLLQPINADRKKHE